MPDLTQEQQKKQVMYRDARFTDQYEDIWQSVGKCVFCALNEKYIFFEENGVVMTVSLYAYIDGHFMIIPRRHIRSTKDLTQTEWDTIRKFTYIAKKLIHDVHGVRGMQLVQKDGAEAQSTVDQHLHFHCIPFDAPDLCQWNYRKLVYTPLENKELYKKARKKIVEYDLKFDKKYRNASALQVVCDAVIMNDRCEVLFQERIPELAFVPDNYSLPGGHVDDFSVDFVHELIREVTEETSLRIPAEDFTLLDSRADHLKIRRAEKHLDVRYAWDKQFVCNTYYAKTPVSSAAALIPGDDCRNLLWIPLDEVADHPRIGSIHKRIIERLASRTRDE